MLFVFVVEKSTMIERKKKHMDRLCFRSILAKYEEQRFCGFVTLFLLVCALKYLNYLLIKNAFLKNNVCLVKYKRIGFQVCLWNCVSILP